MKSIIFRDCISKFIFIMLLFFGSSINAQDVYANSILVKSNTNTGKNINSNIEKDNIEEFVFTSYINIDEVLKSNDSEHRHFFGDGVGSVYYYFQDIYTFKTVIAPGNPGLKTVIRKPVLYNSVLKLEKHYRREVRKGNIDFEDAKNSMLKILEVANAAFYEDTEKFEEELKHAKDIELLDLIFRNSIIVQR